MTRMHPFPLFKVQRPVATNEPEKFWLFYTERHRDDGFKLPEKQVPDRIKRAMGFSHKVYLYLNVTVEPTCKCDEEFDTIKELRAHCTHPPIMEVEYIGAEGSRKRTNW